MSDQAIAQPNAQHVICPNCVAQFRAIPVQVQGLLLAAGYTPPYLEPTAVSLDLPEPAGWASRNVLDGKTRFEKLPVQSLQPGVYEHTQLYTADQMREYARATQAFLAQQAEPA
jgi:hypothetical protein